MDENIGRKFLPWNVYACYSTTKSAIDKWMAQPDSTHQIGLEPTLYEVLIIVESGNRGEAKLAEFFTLRNWRCFRLWPGMGSGRVQPESAQCLARDSGSSDRSREELADTRP